MHRISFLATLGIVAMTAAFAVSPVSAQTLTANTTTNNGGSAGWGMYFDLTSLSAPLTVTSLTTASTAAANAAFNVQVYIRTGTALGGSLTTGPSSSLAGWTSLGTVTATQGATLNGISQSIDIPDIGVGAGNTVGVAMIFTGAGPRYNGTGTGSPQTFSDSNLLLTTGDVRSVPFGTTGSYFSPRGLSGSITYIAGGGIVTPEPGSLALFGLGTLPLAGMVARRRRNAAFREII